MYGRYCEYAYALIEICWYFHNITWNT